MLYSGHVVRRNGKLREVMQRKRHIYEVFAGRKLHSQRTLRCVGAGRRYCTGKICMLWAFCRKKTACVGISEKELSCCEAFCRQETAYSRRVLRRRSVVNQGDLHGRNCMLTHHAGREDVLTACDKNIAIWTNFLQRREHRTARRQYGQRALRATRKEHTKGILQEMNAYCHITGRFVDIKRRVQRAMWYKGAC